MAIGVFVEVFIGSAQRRWLLDSYTPKSENLSDQRRRDAKLAKKKGLLFILTLAPLRLCARHDLFDLILGSEFQMRLARFYADRG